jgi:preprotein translocase subunit Sec61beta
MARRKYRMPSSGGGIMRYGEEYSSKLMLKPGHVIIIIGIIVLVVILLNTYGATIFGFG